MSKSKIYKRRNSGGRQAVHTFIEVKDGTIVRAWCDIPGGQYRGNDPLHLIGQEANAGWLKQNGYRISGQHQNPQNHPGG